MKTNAAKTKRRPPADAGGGNSLEIRKIRPSEAKRFDDLLGRYHYLGEGRPAGDTLRMVAEIEGEWVGLLMWGAAAYRLKPRDSYIGWTPTQCAERQKLIAQNRRFLLLGKRGEHPNRASQILGAAVRALPGLWFESFGYEPLLAETFTDIEAYAGTCYKASGWIPLGLSKGYSRHRADFYVPNARPKKLWVRLLRPNALECLRAMHVPEECQAGAHSHADGVLPLTNAPIESLHEALCTVPDPRASNRSFHIGAILSIVAMAVFSGHLNLVQIVRFARRMNNDQRKRLGLPRVRPESVYRKVPSYKVFYNLLRKVDVEAFAQCLSAWLARHEGSLPTALALDGKFIRDTVGLICLADHETGAPRAIIKTSKKEGEGRDCELKAAQRLLAAQKDLSGKLITADALHAQHDTLRTVVEKGGEMIVQVKDNQKKAHKRARALTEDLAPLLPAHRRPMGG